VLVDIYGVCVRTEREGIEGVHFELNAASSRLLRRHGKLASWREASSHADTKARTHFGDFIGSQG